MAKKNNPIKYLQDNGFRITSDPNEYYESYNPNKGQKPWGKRDLQSYGVNADAYCGGYHRAYDFAKSHNAAIPAIADAQVLKGTGWNTFGWTLVLGFYDATGTHYQVIYGHLNRNPLLDFKVGQTVKKGQTVAYQGSSNNIGVSNMASHLHIQFQEFGALAEQPFTCNGLDPLNIDVSKTGAKSSPVGGSLTIKKQLISNTAANSGRNNKKKNIVIHETANTSSGADAQAHANLQSNGNSRAAAWHWQVDDEKAIQSFTHDWSLWQSGDGSGDGNMHSIAIEICVNSDGDYNKAVQNAVELTKKIMKDEGIGIGNVKQHNFFSGKNCPTKLRAGSGGWNWSKFIDAVKGASGNSVSDPAKPDESKPASKPKPSAKKTPYTVGSWKTNKHGTQYIEAHGTFTVGGTRIMSHEASPFVSATNGGWANPGFKIKYDELVRQDGHVWIGYTQNGKRWYLPYNTWNSRTGAVGSNAWGTFS